ncbi:hypothetical protein C1H46_018202 [Malus baccata]|uniref:Uncharacterized protein n=1 Tax=Malus baccata TaxID=106549 RepID=A0A540MBQ8_MALBA|nr:hypothetical protein C1H46_018202 [Malus baccata]
MVYLENIGINQFSRLLEAKRKISMSVKLSTKRSRKSDTKETHQALAGDDKFDYNLQIRKETDEDKETYPPLACSEEEFQTILDTKLEDGAIKPTRL